ncbi:MAG TPA: cation diffusion facilitator family transporter [Cytophagaceae bacterium]|jgi:cation diffusion facilitator family transporter|nr:cation diffusion facilitator family transporter [Cytophagaceae bacterium]
MNESEHSHNHSHEHDFSVIHERHTKWVVYLSAFTMLLEIGFGYWTNSMALLADGWHMASHVFALGLTWTAYIVSRKLTQKKTYSFHKKKLFALSGYTSAIVLFIIAILMACEAFGRLFNPLEIKFGSALLIAFIGLVVNGLSAFLLHHKHHDHNIRSAYLHVLADGLTSLTAIIALLIGMYYKLYSLDAVSGIISSIIITKWSFDLIKNSGIELIELDHKHE